MQLSVAESHEKDFRVVCTELSRLFNFGSVDRDLASYLVTIAYGGVQIGEDHLTAEFGLMDEDIQKWEVKKMAVFANPSATGDDEDEDEETEEVPVGANDTKVKKSKRNGGDEGDPMVSWPAPRPTATSNSVRPEVALAGAK